ncbi:MAG: 3-hydroxyacyl-ACP dehydratase FabZ [Desulfobulbaceae bacterium]|nr:3-hydroxyacyl-ACP dehydratase FabZ [Desulfobulbaceae bacterium]
MSSDYEQYDIVEILKLLPHRYPFVMVDRILEVDKGERILCLKNVTVNENFFPGHFPSEPIFPGVLIMEGLAQAGALLAYMTGGESVEGKLVYFAGMDGVRFRRKVIPGDQLTFEVTVNKRKGRIWKLDGKAFVGEELAAEGQLLATFA